MRSSRNQDSPGELRDIQGSALRSNQRRENRRTIDPAAWDRSDALESYSNIVSKIHSNQINRGNAFENRFTDYLDNLFGRIDGDDPEAWQRYSGILDSFSRVYGYCVDYLHSETYKVLGGLTRANVEQPREEEEEESRPTTTRRRNPGGSSTLERSVEAINTKNFEKSEDFDPYFKLISSKFDASSAEGLLLNNLNVNGGCELILGDDDNFDTPEEPEQNATLNLENFLTITEEELMNLELSEEINEFERTKLNKPQPAAGLEQILNNMDVEVFGPGSGSEDSLPEDGPDDTNFSDAVDQCFNRDLRSDLPEFSTVSITDRLNYIAENNDYSYFNNAKLGAWAGFEYWNRLSNPFRPQVQRSERKKTKKAQEEFKLDPSSIQEKQKVLEPPKKGRSVAFSGNTTKKSEELKLPHDYCFSLQRFTKLFSRPQTSVKYHRNEDAGLENVVLDNQEVNSEQDFEDEPDRVLFAQESEIPFAENYEENLKYSVSSKTIDIRKLKETIWTKMRGCLGEGENSVVKTEKNTFMELLGELPGELSSEEVSNLSVHSCFITMLHIANEQNLSLQPSSGCDFYISSL